MGEVNLPVRIASFTLVGIGLILLSLNIIFDGSINVALPLVFLVLGGGFFILVFRFRQKWNWASYLYIPGSLLAAFGIIFLLNTLTRDWNSWAYAWLLLVAAIGVGMLLAGRSQNWPPAINLVGWGLAAAGITFFCVFGAITGGLFIQIFAPILLVAAGLSLRWLHLETILPESVLRRLRSPAQMIQTDQSDTVPAGSEMVEPLSSRELEILHLIGAGLSNQQIAEKLTVASSTVKTHINNIYGKLGVQTRVQAVNRARELGIIDS